LALLAADDPCRADWQVLWTIGWRNIPCALVACRMVMEENRMKTHRFFSIAFAFAISLTTANGVIAQESQFRRMSVGSRVNIEVPAHWHIRDLDERKNISAAGEVLTEGVGKKNEPNHVSALSVVSRPEPVGAIIRVSFIPIDDLSQASLVREIQSDRAAVLREVAGAFREDMEALRKVMGKQGMQILGQEKVGIDTIGGLTAFTLTYRRTSAVSPSPFTVTQYHVPIGKEKVLFSLSYRESDGRMFGLILDRVKRSITIK
jgi:hypothetical protein